MTAAQVPPELPTELIRDTNALLVSLDRTLASLREFTDQLHAATEPPQEGSP